MANQTSAGPASSSFALRLGFLYAALFLVIGCYLPYLPVWLKWRDLDADQIAILLAATLYTRILVTPAISFAADRIGDRRTILMVLAWGSLASFVILWVSDGFWQMLLAMVLLAANWTSIMPLIETVAASGIRSGRIDYGRVRLWGSITFILASLGSGSVIQFIGAQAVLPILLGATALMVLATHLMPRQLGRQAAAARAPARRIKLADAFALARAPLFLLFLLATSMIQASHALMYAFGTLHWRTQGFSGGTIGALWSIGVIAEVGLFAMSGRVLAKSGTARLLGFAGGAAAIRWAFMAFDPVLWATGLLQILHAMSFGAAHLAAIHFLTHAVPEERGATAQGLYAAVVAGLVMGSLTLACGPLYRMFGGEAYGVMAVLALIGTVAAFLLHRRWRGGHLVGDQPHNSGEAGNTRPAS